MLNLVQKRLVLSPSPTAPLSLYQYVLRNINRFTFPSFLCHRKIPFQLKFCRRRIVTACNPRPHVRPMSSQELLRNYAYQQPELRKISARVRPLVTLRKVLVLFSKLLILFGYIYIRT